MKIGYVLSGPPGSGLHTYASRLADALDAYGEEVVRHELGMLTGPAPEALRLAHDALGDCDVLHVQVNRKTWGGPASADNLSRFLAEAAVPVVATLHDVYPAPRQPLRAVRRLRGGRVGDRLDRRLRGILRRQAAAVLVLSPQEKERLGNDEATTIPHFVEPMDLPSQKQARRALGVEGRKVVTLLGFLHPRKGCDTMVEVAKELPDDIDVRLVGGAPKGMDAYVQDLGKRAEEADVEVTGFVSDDALPIHMAATDLAVCPFEDVSSSGSLAAWVGAGRPVLAQRLPALEEWVEPAPEAVRFTDADDPQAWARRIRDELERDPRPALEAQRYLQEAYGPGATARRHLAIYEDVTTRS